MQQAAPQVKEAEEEGEFSDDETDEEEEQGEAETEEDEEQAMPEVARPEAKLKGEPHMHSMMMMMLRCIGCKGHAYFVLLCHIALLLLLCLLLMLLLFLLLLLLLLRSLLLWLLLLSAAILHLLASQGFHVRPRIPTKPRTPILMRLVRAVSYGNPKTL